MRSIIDATYVRPAWSSRLCDRAQHLLLVGDQSSHAWPVLHPLEMRQTILELGKVEVELGAPPKAPEKVGNDGGILEAGLIADGRGALYGTAKFGGNVNPKGPCGVDGCGVVFRLTGTGFRDRGRRLGVIGASVDGDFDQGWFRYVGEGGP